MSMKQLILGIFIGAFAIAGVSYAITDSNSLHEIEATTYGLGTVTKFYDENDNVACYTNDGGPSGYGISCVLLK